MIVLASLSWLSAFPQPFYGCTGTPERCTGTRRVLAQSVALYWHRAGLGPPGTGVAKRPWVIILWGDILIDLHIHTTFSPDSTSTLKEILEIARERRLTVVGISDHHDPESKMPDIAYIHSVDDYVKAIQSMREAYDFELLVGLELGIQSTVDEIPQGDFDYMIYSVHEVPESYRIERLPDPWNSYLRECLAALRPMPYPGFFGHLDFLRRYVEGHEPLHPSALLDQVLEKIASLDLGIEVNTSGWRHPFYEQNPQAWIIERFVELGGRYITVGSDAHSKDVVGEGVDEALRLLSKLGVPEVFYCKQGDYEPLPITSLISAVEM